MEVAITAILLYPALGPNIPEDEKGFPKANPKLHRVFSLLKPNDGMVVFKYIFKNNNKELLTRFFNHPYILKIWDPIIKPNLSSKVCFGKD